MTDIMILPKPDPFAIPASYGAAGNTGVKGDPGSPGEGYATRAAMAGRAAPALKDDVYLTEPGREGKFVVGDATAWSSLITADTEQGVFAVSTTDSSKVYIRIEALAAWRFNVRHFGAALDNTTNDGAAVSAACALSNALKRASAIAGVEYGSGAGPTVYVPGLAYMSSTGLTTTHSFKLSGDNTGLPAGIVSGLRWADGVTGITINNPGLFIEGLALVGGFTGTESEHHAILATAPFQYRNLSFGYWAGDFMHLDPNIGYGNVDGVTGENVWGFNGRDAYNNVAGGNNSAGAHKNWNIDTCRRWGMNENTFLGVDHDGHQAAGCSLSVYNDGVSIGCAVTSFSGNRYFAINGQEVWCSTHSPSGDTTDNQGWAYLSAGGAVPSSGIIAWFSGILVRAGGSYLCTGTNVGSNWRACYGEGGQGSAQINAPSRVMSPAMAVWRGSSAAVENAFAGVVTNPGGYKAKGGYTGTDETFESQLGEKGALQTVLQATSSIKFPFQWRLLFSGGDLGYSYSGGVFYATWTGPNTALQFGTGAAVPFAAYFAKLMIGLSSTSARLMTNGTAAPTTGAHGQGEIVWNSASTVGQPKGWMCTVAGTPGTWVSMGNL